MTAIIDRLRTLSLSSLVLLCIFFCLLVFVSFLFLPFVSSVPCSFDVSRF